MRLVVEIFVSYLPIWLGCMVYLVTIVRERFTSG
jgi:hypothetical protein